MNTIFKPQLFTNIKKGISGKGLIADLSAGLVVGIVAIPLAIAFAIASGVKPEQGLVTAVIAGFLISALGGSAVQIGGPTGAFVILIYGIVQKFGYDGLALATIMAGLMLVTMGALRFGAVIQFIPYPVTLGFTSGIAVIIAAGQLGDALGLGLRNLPPEFIGKFRIYLANLDAINPWALAITGLALLILILWPRINRKIPASIIAIVITTILVKFLPIPVETIQDRFGTIKGSIPLPKLPQIDLANVRELFIPALSLAFLGGLESLLSAVVADGMLGTKHRSNTELIAQGIANIASPLFGGIPATGAIARTATNIKNGGHSPIAGIVHALTVLLIMLLLGPLASLIPLASLSAILMIVAFNMSELPHFIRMFKNPKSDILVMLATFSLTVFVDLTVAIAVGLILALFLFMRRSAELTHMDFIGEASRDIDPTDAPDDPAHLDTADIPAGVEVFEVNGPFFFGAAERFKDTVSRLEKEPKVLILRTRKVLSLDATAMRAIESLWQRSSKRGTHFIISGIHTQPLMAMKKNGLLDLIGQDRVCANIHQALERAKELIKDQG